MLFLLATFAVGAMLAPVLMRGGRLVFLLLAAIPAFSFVALTFQTERVFAGDFPFENWAWAPQVGLELTFQLDHLSWAMGLIVTGVGALVLVYSARYFSASARGMGRFAGVFVGFAGAMLGLVTTDNTLALYLFWELTTVFSYLLIGHNYGSGASRRAANQAIIVTTAGGLAMLAGIVMFGEMPGGSYRISELVEAAQNGTLGIAPITTDNISSWVIGVAIVLILLGATTKSALIPVHFWLPGAMAAPTPVSAYLHAAAMVKAGVYLVARLSPAFSDHTAWQVVVLVGGMVTLILGGYRAIKQYDLKLVLAFGTVSQLGLITLMVGYGTPAMLLAGLAMLLAHSLFKSTLFLAVGHVDWATGTRDLRELSGLGKRSPVIAVIAGLAAASMMGLPFTAGFVAKEAALHALIGGDTIDTITWIAIAIGSAFTVAYTIRFWWGAFASKPGLEPSVAKDTSGIMGLPMAILGSLGIIVGLSAATVERVFLPQASKIAGDPGHLVVWAGVNTAFLVTCLILVVGVGIFVVSLKHAELLHKLTFPIVAERVYRKLISGLESLSGVTTAFTQRGSLPAYLMTIFSFMIGVVLVAITYGRIDTIIAPRLWDSWAQGFVVFITALAAILAARARQRMKAILLMGVSGYGVALIYELYGAPDLALTQVLAETMTLVVYILVLRRLPKYFSNRPLRLSRWGRIALAIAVGLVISIVTWLAAGVRKAEPISQFFHDEAYAYGYGKNIVNVTLVDIRAWDTFGESAVVVACAIGISSLLFIRDRGGRIDRFRNIAVPQITVAGKVIGQKKDDADGLKWSAANYRKIAQTVKVSSRARTWLAGSEQIDYAHRSVIVEVGTRIVFHTIMIVSLFFLFAGHNIPGGGFAGGLLGGIALVLRYLAGGRYELGAAMPLNPGHLMGWGMTITGLAAIVPVFFGGTILQTVAIQFTLPAFGEVKLATALFFDIGVYVTVLGLILDILRSLGAEIDRHGEVEGIEAKPVAIYPSGDHRRDQVDADHAQAFVRDETAEETARAEGDLSPRQQRQERKVRAREMVGAAVAVSQARVAQKEAAEAEAKAHAPAPDKPPMAAGESYDPNTGIVTLAADPSVTSEIIDFENAEGGR
ncbi:MAG: Na+/H+ antiporter subunit A [Actinomycetaceae bacterium]|nr:Na+/H+ antiporter subunit A [Actinomycetaceae bacterium]